MNTTNDITIRSTRPADGAALHRLAALDSQRPLTSGDVLVAEVGGAIVAAVDPRDGRAIADPFLPTASAVDLLRLRAGDGARTAHRERRGIFAALPRLA